MIQSASGVMSKVQDMVSYFETKRNGTVTTQASRRRRSMTVTMNFARRPWEHFPRRKSSSSTAPRRRSSTSTGSESTTYDIAERQIAEAGYAASEGSGTSTATLEGRRRSVNPDYDWEHDGEHDDIAELKMNLNNMSLWSPPLDALLKGSDTPKDLTKVDSASSAEEKAAGNGSPRLREIDSMDLSPPETGGDESRSRSTKEKILTHHQDVKEVEDSQLESLKEEVDENPGADKPATSHSENTKSNVGDSLQQSASAKISSNKPSASDALRVGPLRLKTAQLDKDRKATEATSPNSSSPKSKTRPKLAVELPGIPESEAETLGRQRRLPMNRVRGLTSHPQGMNINRSSRPPVSLRRYPIRSLSSPLPGQPTTSPTQMMDLVNQRQLKFTNIREEKLRRLSSIETARGSKRSQGLMGRRHASCPVSEAPPQKRLARVSISQRLSLSQRRKSVAQSIKGYIQSTRRRSSIFFRRTRSVTR
ncbi:hypothetical protein J7T55_009729 [Diaporthe amygdali]|uniref:uncharacterized protein n=1 Tax=Phomopsis amygdali TaxID=1214568 RepID=UPI0022FE2DDB|nr:uncharacterized protein J7T55_009729 [Diaporthe amygdali]KAJ0116579.1 hypothetical protein J7T55_009729 [Diaporthe amygdali]